MAKEYATKVYAATAKFPRHEDYGLRSQMNRAVNSISLNIAEGSAKSTDKAFAYHLDCRRFDFRGGGSFGSCHATSLHIGGGT
ncbi:MAG: four helix bundle protein [Nitrospirae bacterium]|nr:MAG: four helix bundle protein [Nitrospirota bacterium]